MHEGRNQPTAKRKASQRPLLTSVSDPVQRNQCYLEAGKVGCAVGVMLGLGLL